MFKLPKIRSSLIITIGGTITFFGINLVQGNEKFYKNIVMPNIHKFLNAEQAHILAIKMAKYDLIPNLASKQADDEILSIKVFNNQFSNPIGCAAGLDKNGEAINGLFKLGFGFIEIGSITPLPQEGNAKPRVFRLNEDKAIINRYGFNSDGHELVLERVKKIQPENKQILGINLGKNKNSDNYLNDYLNGLRVFGKYANYIVINISSPNTPGLRNLQKKNELEILIENVIDERNRINKNLPVIVKLAPDLNDQELKDIANTLLAKHIDGIIISNTTITRPESLKSKLKDEIGGLSGRPLKNLSNEIIKKMFILTNGQIPIIGVGGIENGEDALEKIKCGSSLVQLYTSFIYEGPPLINRIKRELTELLKKEGFTSIQQAIGHNLKDKIK